MYHIEYDYTTASMIAEQRVREAEIDRVAAAIRAAKRTIRSVANCVECVARIPTAARRAA